MEILRIPTKFEKTLSRLSTEEQAFILMSLFKISRGEEVEIPDTNAGDLLSLIWYECQKMNEKIEGKKSKKENAPMVAPMVPPMGSSKESKESKVKENKVNKVTLEGVYPSDEKKTPAQEKKIKENFEEKNSDREEKKSEENQNLVVLNQPPKFLKNSSSPPAFVQSQEMEMWNQFVSYWSEEDDKGNQKWQHQRFFEVQKRWESWKAKELKFSKPRASPNQIPAINIF